MADVFHDWGQDLQTTATGDLLSVDSTQRSEQRIIRRLMTIEDDAWFHLGYGGSIPKRVGGAADEGLITGVVRGQMLLEASVSKEVVPQVAVTSYPDGLLTTSIRYAEADTGQQLDFTFDVSP